METVRMSDGCGIKAKILGDEPNKPLMIAHHGAPGLVCHVEAEASYGPFSDIFRVLLFDARGCGDSDKQGPYTHARWIQDIDELRQWATADKIIMAGASHGGFLALDYAVRYPKQLHGILVGDSAAYIAHWGLLNAVSTAMTDPRAVNPDPHQLVRVFSGTLKDMEDLMSAFTVVAPLYAAPAGLKELAEEDPEKVMGAALSPVLDTVNASQSHGYSHYDVRDQLKQIKVPVFVYCGRHDWIMPVKLSEEMARELPKATLVVYERSGHFAALEEKSKFQHDVRAWVESLGSLQ